MKRATQRAVISCAHAARLRYTGSNPTRLPGRLGLTRNGGGFSFGAQCPAPSTTDLANWLVGDVCCSYSLALVKQRAASAGDAPARGLARRECFAKSSHALRDVTPPLQDQQSLMGGRMPSERTGRCLS